MTSKSDYNFELYVNSNVHLQKIEIGQAISLIQLDFKSMGGGGHHGPPPLSLSLSLSLLGSLDMSGLILTTGTF